MISATLQALAERFRRPSALEQLSLCAAAPVMQAYVVSLDGEPPSDPVAALGTDGHDRIAEGIEGWKLCQDTGEHGALWGDAIANTCEHAAADGVDSWTVRCIQSCLEFARDLITKYDIHPDNVLTEHQLDMGSLGFQKIANSGRADLVLVIPGKLVIVIDWKLGFLDQGEADEHDQTQAYAAAAAETFDAEIVEVWLIQPRAPKEHRQTGAKYDADTLRANRAWTVAVLNRSRAENPELVPGYTQCLHCKALLRCPAARKFQVDAQEALQLIGKPLDGPGYAELISAGKTAEKFAEQAKEAGKAYIGAGNKVPGWMLGKPQNMRHVAQPATALATLTDAGISAEQLVLLDALAFKVGNLPDNALAMIEIEYKPKSPSLVPDKSSKSA